jgi:hypothetical protein
VTLQSFSAQAYADVDRLAPDAIAAATELARSNGWDGHVIGEPCPVGKKLYAMAEQFAHPVASGDLHPSAANAALINATLKAEREGQIGTYKAHHIVAGLRHALRLHVAHEDTRRTMVAHKIRRTVAPLIDQHKPRNILLAEAHGVNGAHDFPFSEPEVTDLVATEVYYSLPPAPRGRRYGP